MMWHMIQITTCMIFKYSMVIFGIRHQFLGTPLGTIWSYLEFDISFYVPL